MSCKDLIIRLAPFVGPRMSARILGVSIAYVAQVRKARAITASAKPTPEQVLANLPPDLARECKEFRHLHDRSTINVG